GATPAGQEPARPAPRWQAGTVAGGSCAARPPARRSSHVRVAEALPARPLRPAGAGAGRGKRHEGEGVGRVIYDAPSCFPRVAVASGRPCTLRNRPSVANKTKGIVLMSGPAIDTGAPLTSNQCIKASTAK